MTRKKETEEKTSDSSFNPKEDYKKTGKSIEDHISKSNKQDIPPQQEERSGQKEIAVKKKKSQDHKNSIEDAIKLVQSEETIACIEMPGPLSLLDICPREV